MSQVCPLPNQNQLNSYFHLKLLHSDVISQGQALSNLLWSAFLTSLAGLASKEKRSIRFTYV